MVDWSIRAGFKNKIVGIDYFKSKSNIQITGREIAAFIQTNKIPLDAVYCVGFSLGAHVRSSLD